MSCRSDAYKLIISHLLQTKRQPDLEVAESTTHRARKLAGSVGGVIWSHAGMHI